MTALNATQEISVNMNNLPNNLKSIWQTWQWRRKNNLSFWFCLSRERKTEAIKALKSPLVLNLFISWKPHEGGIIVLQINLDRWNITGNLFLDNVWKDFRENHPQGTKGPNIFVKSKRGEQKQAWEGRDHCFFN